jgi:hypothetical protein
MRPQAVIDKAPFGHNFDFRMVYQSKHGKRPLLPASHADSPLEIFMTDYLPADAKPLKNQFPIDNPPALPGQLAPIARTAHGYHQTTAIFIIIEVHKA